MNMIVKKRHMAAGNAGNRPARRVAEEAVRTLIRWAGDDPDREGLIGTPDRSGGSSGRSSRATATPRS